MNRASSTSDPVVGDKCKINNNIQLITTILSETFGTQFLKAFLFAAGPILHDLGFKFCFLSDIHILYLVSVLIHPSMLYQTIHHIFFNSQKF